MPGFQRLVRVLDNGYEYFCDRPDPGAGVPFPKQLDALITFVPGQVVTCQRGVSQFQATVVVGVQNRGGTLSSDISLRDVAQPAVRVEVDSIDFPTDSILMSPSVKAIPHG